MMTLSTASKYLLPVLFSGICLTASAQVSTPPADPGKNTVAEDIEVIRAYRPVLADAVKIRRSPDLDDTRPFKPNLSYTILDKKLELNTDIRQLQSQALADEINVPVVNNYVKAGAGNFNTGLAEVYVNTGKDEALQGGAWFKHFNQQGDINGQKYSGQELRVFGRSLQESYTVNGGIGYNGRASGFYGVDPAAAVPQTTVQKQRYDILSLNGELLSRDRLPRNTLDYVAKADAYLMKDSYKGRENSFLVSGYVNKNLTGFHAGANVTLDFTSTRDSLSTISNNIFRVNPFVKLQGKQFSLTIGANLVQEFGTVSNTNFLPAVTAEVTVVPQFATVFAGYTGDVIKTSLIQLSRENAHLSAVLPIQNALQKTNIYGGVRGNAGSGFGYKVSASYKTIENMPFFVNNPVNFRKFDVVYDEKAEVVGFEGEISAKAGILTWTGKVNANTYTLSSEEQPWFKPGVLLSSNVRVAVNKKLVVTGDVLLSGDTKGVAYDLSGPVIQRRVASIKSYADFSAGAEYRIKDRIGVYLQANNLFGSNYQQFLYYPVIGLNVFGGLNYSF